MTDDPKPLADGLDRIMRGLGRAPIDIEAEIMRRWRQSPGSASRARIASVTATTIVIETDDPALASEMRWNARDLAMSLDPEGHRSVTVRVRGERRT